MVISELPDAVFRFTVTVQERDRLYAATCVSTPAFGRVARSHELFRLEELGKNGCRLILTNTVEFDGELDEDEWALEMMMLTFSSFSAIEKIKLHAEEGSEAVRALSEEMAEGLGDFDCGDD